MNYYNNYFLLICLFFVLFRFFLSIDSLLFHITNDHLNKFDKSALINSADINKKITEYLFLCRWPACDLIPRSKWSMVTHLQVF